MMIKTKCLCSGLILASVLDGASAKVTLVFARPGAYMVTVRSGEKVLKTLSGQDTKLLDISDVPKDAEKATALVEDTATGNEAILPLPKEGQVPVKPEAFNTISRVSIDVSDAKGAKPDVAVVTLKDGKGDAQTVTLLPQDAGRASFRHVASGDGSVRVQQGAPTNHQSTDIRLPVQRSAPVLEIPVALTLPDGMKTGTPSQAPGQPGGAPPVHTGPGPLAGLLGFVVALAVIVVGAIFALNVLHRKGVTIQSTLAAAGVQLPEDAEPIPTVAAEPPPPADPGICPFCGARKDPNAPCANCSVSAGRPPVAAAAATGAPRLIALTGPRAGEVFPLTGAISVGRDPARDVAITEDPALSRQHATIQPSASGASIADSGSSNGTWVNGRRVDAAELKPGDEIVMGASRFRYEG